MPQGAVAYAINGVSMFSWASAGCCDVGVDEIDVIENCNAHPAGGGVYHYHIWPRCLDSCEQGVPSGIIGVALDGFPIYGPIDDDGHRKSEKL